MKKRFMIVLMFIILIFGVKTLWQQIQSDPVQAKAALVFDVEEGKIIFQQNSKEVLPIASLTKMMTQYLVLEAIEERKISWDTTYEPTITMLEKTAHPQLAKLGMEQGVAYTVEELFTAMTISSANDAAIALAETVSGSEEQFVQRMNEKAKQFGLQNTTFINATGLDEEETNQASARDVVAIAQQLITDFPSILNITKKVHYTTRQGEKRWSTNHMLPGMPEGMAEIDGLKTGYTEAAGECFISTGEFHGNRIITVVLGANMDSEEGTQNRFEVTRQLIDQYVVSSDK